MCLCHDAQFAAIGHQIALVSLACDDVTGLEDRPIVAQVVDTVIGLGGAHRSRLAHLEHRARPHVDVERATVEGLVVVGVFTAVEVAGEDARTSVHAEAAVARVVAQVDVEVVVNHESAVVDDLVAGCVVDEVASMVVAIVDPGIVIAVHHGNAADGGIGIVLELTAAGGVQFGGCQVAVVDDDRKGVLHRYFSCDIDHVAIDEHAVVVRRQLAGLDASVVVDVHTVVEHQLVLGHNLGAAGDVVLTVGLQVGSVLLVQHEGSSAQQIDLGIASHIEAAVREIVVADDVERAACAVGAPDVDCPGPRRVDIARARRIARLVSAHGSILLYAAGEGRQELVVVSVVWEVIRV